MTARSRGRGRGSAPNPAPVTTNGLGGDDDDTDGTDDRCGPVPWRGPDGMHEFAGRQCHLRGLRRLDRRSREPLHRLHPGGGRHRRTPGGGDGRRAPRRRGGCHRGRRRWARLHRPHRPRRTGQAAHPQRTDRGGRDEPAAISRLSGRRRRTAGDHRAAPARAGGDCGSTEPDLSCHGHAGQHQWNRQRRSAPAARLPHVGETGCRRETDAAGVG